MLKIPTCCALFMLYLSGVFGQGFTIQDELISSADAQIIDTEFDPYHNRICWQSGDDNQLWVCRLDTITWGLTVPNGKETLIDTALVPISQTSNGGEWGYDVNGTYIFYNKLINKTRYIAVAAEYAPSWILTTFTDAPNRINAHATQNPADSAIGFHYIRTQSSDHTKYKFLDYPTWERQVLWFTDAHWAQNEPVLTGILCNGQVAMVDFRTCPIPEELTDEPGTEFSCPYIWRAPEKGNQRMFFARANNNEIRVYKEFGPISGQFALYMSFMSPSANPAYDKIASPEPTIYQGQSYITFMASSSPYETAHVPSEIWIARLDSIDPLFRMVSDPSMGIRTDPETFATPDSLLVYYTEAIQPNSPEASYRLRKCATGIGVGLPTNSGDGPQPANTIYRAWPNPFNDRITVSPLSGSETFTLTGLSGMQIWSGDDIRHADFSHIPKGIYFLTIASGISAQTIIVVRQ